MLDSSKKLLALFSEYKDSSLSMMDYGVIKDHEKAIRELENLGLITVCDDVIGSIELA